MNQQNRITWFLRVGPVLAVMLAGCFQNKSPEILPISSQTAYVGAQVAITVEASDPDNDLLSFSFSSSIQDLSNRSRFITQGDEAFFTWTPLVQDVGSHQINFEVDDGSHVAYFSVSI